MVVEADIFDRTNETEASIAQRAYEIYESRGGGHGSDQDDWFTAEQEVLHPLAIERYVTDGTLRLTAQLPVLRQKTWKGAWAPTSRYLRHPFRYKSGGGH